MNELPDRIVGAQALPADPVVILVDNRTRDLPTAALIAHHLERFGVPCRLEPLEAFRAVLAADRPSMVVFNHLNASHLVEWSQRLAKLGVLTAVLPNEGIAYDPDVLRYLAGRYHNGAHVDYFFCWNEPHRTALHEQGFDKSTHVEVTGVPRFDFYFEPWSKLVQRPAPTGSGRPKVLFCTNFITAKFRDLPPENADRLFSQWADRVPLYKDYWSAIHSQWRARERSLDHVKALLQSGKFDVTLRPHPGEDAEFYRQWLDTLPADERARVRFDPQGDIFGLILDCDLEISCETCTTAMESWIAGKPTVELVFERHPLWYREAQARANYECGDPAELVAAVETHLRSPGQAGKREERRRHLADWCASPDGTSSERIARIIALAVTDKRPADWSQLSANDHRRALKLRLTRAAGVPYHIDPLLAVKRVLLADRYAMKDRGYRKSIRPGDVREIRRRLAQAPGR